MPATLLEHYNVYCKDLKKTVDFYVKYVGLRDGDRPPFNFPGAWMYAGEQAVLHLVFDSGRTDHGSGAIDHIALRCTGIRDTVDLLKKDNVPHVIRKVPARPLQQVFVHDPDGIQIEMNFYEEPLVEGVSEMRETTAPTFRPAPVNA
jgi:catechol 2,3-dioxygenase-like lactoylglutathione lyase family enzyme